MQRYEKQHVDQSEDQKMHRLQEDLKSKEHSNEVKKLKDKLAMVESSRNERAKEL